MMLASQRLATVPGVVHGFTTRNGGVSRGELHSLHLGLEGEAPGNLAENWRRVASALGLSRENITVAEQVHGACVLEGNAGFGPMVAIGEADALVCTAPGQGVAVRVADCVPILLAVPGGVAAVHAGWRGTAQGIAKQGVSALCLATGADPAEVVAAVGPRIGACCYAVGPEVVEGIGVHVAPEVFVSQRGSATHVDLGAANAAQLQAAGVTDIDVLDACTACESRFFSHRRDGPGTGRLAAVIGLERE
jgi:YfiH family protein